MTGSNGQQPDENAESKLTVTFNAYGSAEFEMNYTNVTPMQLLSMAEWFKWHALQKLEEQAKQTDDRVQ
jgi:hypothetical protein